MSDSSGTIWKYSGLTANGMRLNGKIRAENKEEALTILSRMSIQDPTAWKDGEDPAPEQPVEFKVPDKIIGFNPSSSSESSAQPDDQGPSLDMKPEVPPNLAESIKANRVFSPPTPVKRRETIVFGEIEVVRQQSEAFLSRMNGRIKKVKIQPNLRGTFFIFLVVEHDVILGETDA